MNTLKAPADFATVREGQQTNSGHRASFSKKLDFKGSSEDGLCLGPLTRRTMKKSASKLISFGFLAIVGVIITGTVFIISNNIKDNTNSQLVEDFSENIILVVENKMIEMEKIINYSSADSETYLQMKENIPAKIGENTYTIIGDNTSLLFNSQNYGLTKRKNISWSKLNAKGMCFSGNEQIILTFNSSKSNDTIVLS